jgi:hypothetical protein
MPYSVIEKNCSQSNGEKGEYVVINNETKQERSCHKSKQKAEDSIKAIYANKLKKEIKDYFLKKDKDYLEFQDHPLSNIEDLLDPDKPAPWDHLTNTKDDEDVDIEIE